MTTGFVLESADSVRFGSEYTEVERERNRQLLFGEMLCGLLMGEPIWTSAVFAFDSQGMVEVLGAISRAFMRTPNREQFLPFIVSAYAGDKDPWTGNPRPWLTPGELFLRCYAHRLRNHDFQLSATPGLQPDKDRRTKLAESMRAGAESGCELSKLDVRADEAGHFRDILSIDRFLRSWLGGAVTSNFESYSNHAAPFQFPIRKVRDQWSQSYERADSISKIRYFLESAATERAGFQMDGPGFAQAREILGLMLELPPDHSCFQNRSKFRTELKTHCDEQASPFRVLIELVDGHYIRTQYTELTHAAREVTSPASNSVASAKGDTWAAATMCRCLKSPESVRPWQFINRIKAVPSADRVRLRLDDIAVRFADFVTHPDRRGELVAYHELLRLARDAQRDGGGSDGQAKRRFGELQLHVEKCIGNINRHMDGTGVDFHFNVNDAATCAGSLTLTFGENESTSQCTGPEKQPVPEKDGEGLDASEGFNNNFTGARD